MDGLLEGAGVAVVGTGVDGWLLGVDVGEKTGVLEGL